MSSRCVLACQSSSARCSGRATPTWVLGDIPTTAERDSSRGGTGNTGSGSHENRTAPADRSHGPDNRHRGADQWLYVISGTGAATINGKRYRLRRGSLLLIERRGRA